MESEQVHAQVREAAMVIWVTGLSGAGKTTLCTALYGLLKPRRPGLVLLDGDAVRAAFGGDLGHSESDRWRQVKRLQAMAKLLADQDMAVIVAVLYAHPELLAWNRENIPGYFEIYLDASLETVKARDDKLIYAKAEAGQMPDVVGIDIPWHAPEAPDLVIDANHPEPPAAMARRVADAIPFLAPTVARVAGERA